MKKTLSILAMAEAMIAPLSMFQQRRREKKEVALRNAEVEADTIRKAEEKRLRKQQKRLAHAS